MLVNWFLLALRAGGVVGADVELAVEDRVIGVGDEDRVGEGECCCCRSFQNRRPSKTSGAGKYRSSSEIPASGVKRLVPGGRCVPSDKSIGFMTLRMKEAMVGFS